MRAISPDLGLPEKVIGEDQLDFLAIPVAIGDHPSGRVVIARYALNEQERQQVKDGADLFLQLLVGERGGAQPHRITIGPPNVTIVHQSHHTT